MDAEKRLRFFVILHRLFKDRYAIAITAATAVATGMHLLVMTSADELGKKEGWRKNRRPRGSPPEARVNRVFSRWWSEIQKMACWREWRTQQGTQYTTLVLY